MKKIWLPWSAHKGTHVCRVCGAKGVPTGHFAKCFAQAEDEYREQSAAVLIGHADPELEAFMATHGGVNRPKGGRKRAA